MPIEPEGRSALDVGMRIDISALAADFPDFRVAVIVADRMAITLERPEALDRLIADRQAAARLRWSGTELGAIPGIAVWRQAYKAFGIKKTSYRCSVERLVKNAVTERPLPVINSFVDAYNAVSFAHVFPVGADDLALVSGDLAFRYARDNDSFVDMAGSGEDGAPGVLAEDPPKPGEVVYADGAHVLCRRWNWRQDVRSLVSVATTRAVLTIQSNGTGDLDAAVADVSALIERFCGGHVAAVIADASTPIRELPET